jgi:hypothetical protein
MILLDTVNKSLEVVLGGAITTNQLPWSASYTDIDTAATFALSAAAASNGATTSGTAVTMVAAPAASHTRRITFLSVHNADTVAATITVRLNDSATTRTLWKGTLQTLETLTYTLAGGWVVTDVTGALRNSLADEDDLSLADNTTNNVTSTKHGFAPKSAADATKFLNGAATPAYAQVKDSDLAFTDITTNDVSTSKHGFVPKAPNDSTKFLNGAYAVPAGTVDNSICDGRLTLTTAVPVTTADVTGATSIFFTPYRGNRIALYDGSTTWNIRTFSEITIAVGTLSSGKPYDLFAFDNSGTVAFDSPVAWTNDTTRATALVLQDGVLVKSGATTRRYIGTFYTTATTTTEDSFAKRFLWNYYNRVPRVMRVMEATNSWNYTTATFRQANAAAANQLDCVIGYAEMAVEVNIQAEALNDQAAASVAVIVAIGENSTSTPHTSCVRSAQHNFAANVREPLLASLRTFPAVGRNFYAWLEYSTAAGTTTWYGDNGGLLGQSGIHGILIG